ncbi:MAG: hypothetical protein WC942_11745, partial [Clostridia bacterium]
IDKVGFSLTHKVGDKDIQKWSTEGKFITEKYPIIKVDLVRRFVAPIEGEIDFGEIRKLITDLKDLLGFNITTIISDTYQSLDMKQTMSHAGYKFIMHGTDGHREVYDTFLEMILDDRLDFYIHAPLMYELQRLEDKNNKIDHTRTSSKDLADAVVLAAYFAAGGESYQRRSVEPHTRSRIKKGKLVPGISNRGGGFINQISSQEFIKRNL